MINESTCARRYYIICYTIIIHYRFSWDFVFVYDGDSDTAPLLAKLTGKLADGTFKSIEGLSNLVGNGNILSTSNNLFIHFESDDAEVWAGFKIQFDRGRNEVPKMQKLYS